MKRLKILFLSCFLFLTACQSGMNDSDLPAESPIEEEERSTTEDGYSTRDQEGKIDEDNMDWAEREEWKGTGLYKGKVESNAVEIEIDNELKTFKLTKEAEKDVEYLDDDEKVSYIYRSEERRVGKECEVMRMQ